MKGSKSKSNLFVGAKVLIDYPQRWRVDEGHLSDEEKKQTSERRRQECEAAAKSPEMSTRMGAQLWHWGETGTIMAYNPNDSSGKEYEVLLDNTKEIVSFHYGALTVTYVPHESDVEALDLLRKILDAVTIIKDAPVLDKTNRVLQELVHHLRTNK